MVLVTGFTPIGLAIAPMGGITASSYFMRKQIDPITGLFKINLINIF
jgi:hypothetical protein